MFCWVALIWLVYSLMSFVVVVVVVVVVGPHSTLRAVWMPLKILKWLTGKWAWSEHLSCLSRLGDLL